MKKKQTANKITGYTFIYKEVKYDDAVKIIEESEFICESQLEKSPFQGILSSYELMQIILSG